MKRIFAPDLCLRLRSLLRFFCETEPWSRLVIGLDCEAGVFSRPGHLVPPILYSVLMLYFYYLFCFVLIYNYHCSRIFWSRHVLLLDCEAGVSSRPGHLVPLILYSVLMLHFYYLFCFVLIYNYHCSRIFWSRHVLLLDFEAGVSSRPGHLVPPILYSVLMLHFYYLFCFVLIYYYHCSRIFWSRHVLLLDCEAGVSSRPGHLVPLILYSLLMLYFYYLFCFVLIYNYHCSRIF